MSKPVIICVDDERVVLDTLVTQLESHFGNLLELETANTGEEAIELAQSLIKEGQEIAVVISDQLMPGLKGDEVLTKIHRMSDRTMTILLTGQSSADAVGRAVNSANLYRFVTKPWDKTDLMLTVESALVLFSQNHQIEDQNKILESLFYASNQIAKINGIEFVIHEIIKIILNFSEADRGVLVQFDSEERMLLTPFVPEKNSETLSLKIDTDNQSLLETIVVDAKNYKKYSSVSNCNSAPWKSDPYVITHKPKSIYCTPLSVEERILAFVYLESYSKYDAFDKHISDFIQLFSIQAGIALGKAELYDDLEAKVKHRTAELSHQKALVEEIFQDLSDSIQYAHRIQEATLSNIEEFESFFPDSSIQLLPKDVVSGDFYWHYIRGETIYFAVIDCTGHGVPGAILSILGNNILSNIVENETNLSPARILGKLHDKLIMTLAKNNSYKSLDGMDMIMLKYEKGNNRLLCAMAGRPLIHLREKNVSIIKSEKISIGGFTPKDHQFIDNVLEIEKGDSIFLFTDGITDQFGGDDNRKMSAKILISTLVENNILSIKDIISIIVNDFHRWKGNETQTDDVLIVGVRF